MALNTLSNISVDTNKLQLISVTDLTTFGQGYITTKQFIESFAAQYGVGYFCLNYQPTSSLNLSDITDGSGATINITILQQSPNVIATAFYISRGSTPTCMYYSYTVNSTGSWNTLQVSPPPLTKLTINPSSGLTIDFTQSYVHLIPGAAIYNIMGKAQTADGISKAAGSGICTNIPVSARPPEDMDVWIFAQTAAGEVVRCTANIKTNGNITTTATANYTYFRVNCVVPTA